MNNHATQALALLERISRIINNEAATSYLKPAQWEALRFLNKANRFSRTPSALTAYLGVTKGSVSQTLNALERKGYIEKSTAKDDKRSVTILLTSIARTALEEDPLKVFSTVFEHIDPQKLENLSTGLALVLRTALNQRDNRIFGPCKTCTHFTKKTDLEKTYWCSLLKEPLSAEDSELLCKEQID